MSVLDKIVAAFPEKKIGLLDFGGLMGDPCNGGIEYCEVVTDDYHAAANLISNRMFEVVAVHGLTLGQAELLEDLSGVAPLILPPRS